MQMVFQGFLAFLDPPKDSAKEALRLLFQKSVQVKVMTGDTLAVAVKVCRDVGIPTEHVVTGPELSLMENEEFTATVRRATILAKLTPIQKLNAIQVINQFHISDVFHSPVCRSGTPHIWFKLAQTIHHRPTLIFAHQMYCRTKSDIWCSCPLSCPVPMYPIEIAVTGL